MLSGDRDTYMDLIFMILQKILNEKNTWLKI